MSTSAKRGQQSTCECGHDAPHTWDYGCNQQVSAEALCPCSSGYTGRVPEAPTAAPCCECECDHGRFPHTVECPSRANEDPAEDLPCPCDCSCESLAACLRLADERWPDPPHWPKDAHRVGICCDDSGMIANPDGDALIPCPGGQS